MVRARRSLKSKLNKRGLQNFRSGVDAVAGATPLADALDATELQQSCNRAATVSELQVAEFAGGKPRADALDSR